jgi:hypothetical protein
MNERIRELWSQAGGHYDSGNQHTWPQYTIDDPEKFAELIVRECADVLLEWKKEPFPLDPDFAANLIKEHFGVEE